MFHLAQRVASRCAAAVVALTLSGLPELVEPSSHAAGHRCHCPVREGKHECDCPLCHAEAARRGSAATDDPSPPACHKALAVKTRAEVVQADQRRASAAPCLTSTCGTADGRLRPPPAAERFTVPPGWTLTFVEWSAEVEVAADLVIMEPREPETPPPRFA
jgi:hypothetical protein